MIPLSCYNINSGSVTGSDYASYTLIALNIGPWAEDSIHTLNSNIYFLKSGWGGSNPTSWVVQSLQFVGTSISWFSKVSDDVQLNKNNTTYYYIAIG